MSGTSICPEYVLFFGQIELTFSAFMPRAPSLHSFDSLIARRVKAAKRGTVFTPDSFAALGSRASIDKALQRLAARGELRRLSRGLYDRPREDELLGVLWPSVDAVVKAIAGRNRLRTQPAGAYAANLLGLSEQVPAKVLLLTDGVSRTVQAGPMRITLKRTTPRQMAAAGRLSGLLIQAFKSIGAAHLSSRHVEHLRATIPAEQRVKVANDVALAPIWMRPGLLAVARADDTRPARRRKQ